MVYLFRQIRVCLSWESDMECAVLLDKDLDVEDQNSSFYKNYLPEKSDKSQIAAEE